MADYLTQTDVDNYGPELINVTQRAALQAIEPELNAVRQQNAALQQRLAVESRRALDQRVAALVPNFREIDRMPEWHRYLLGVDALSGRVRQQLLNESIANGDTNRVVSFFRGFQREAGAQSAAAPASRTTPSRRMSDKPYYTRTQIAQLYSRHQRGAYANREAEWNRIESDIIAAGREGRIQNPMDLHGK